MSPINLFALTADSTQRVLRLPLASSVQIEVIAAFQDQEAAFAQSTSQEIDFDGKYRPESGECLVIKDYDDIDNLGHYITNPLSAPEIKF